MAAQRSTKGAMRAIAAVACLAGLSSVLAACGQPEEQLPSATASAASAVPVPTVLPPYPTWSDAMIGKPLSRFLIGHGTCVGVFDAVADRYAGKRAGVVGQGWGWDVGAKTPVKRVLFTNADDIVVGAGDGGLPRPDVSRARQDVTSPNTGWRAVIGITGGKVLAVGVTSRNAACSVGSFDISAES